MTLTATAVASCGALPRRALAAVRIWATRATWVASATSAALALACSAPAHAQALAASAPAAAQAPARAYTITDDTGHTARFDTPPARIVSLLPSITETVCALGACQRLVGVDRYSTWPDSLHALPRVGGGLDPNVEAIVALRPDVVLMASSSRAAPRLRALGIRVLALEPKTRADVRRVIHTLGQTLQVDGADALARQIDAGVAAAAQALPASARGQRVYFEVSPAPHAAGPGSFIGELLSALGLANIIGPQLGPFPKINPELVVRAAPDVIMTSEAGAQDMARRPGWAALQAVRTGRICAFTPAERDILVRPGPRMAEAARLMKNCVAPDAAARP
ncbi:MAG: helical backbone metal receptor [Pseudomonadota bacterium]|nr:helical backbone metal receptor [Pseudomonadota bacterium]